MHAVDEERGALVGNPNLTFKHDYPATKLMFIPVWGCGVAVVEGFMGWARFLASATRHDSWHMDALQDKEGTRPDLLATTGEFLRIWQVGEDGVTLERLLNNVSLCVLTLTRKGQA